MSDLAGRELTTAAPDMVTTYIMGTGGGYLCSGHCCLHGAHLVDLTAVIGSHGNSWLPRVYFNCLFGYLDIIGLAYDVVTSNIAGYIRITQYDISSSS